MIHQLLSSLGSYLRDDGENRTFLCCEMAKPDTSDMLMRFLEVVGDHQMHMRRVLMSSLSKPVSFPKLSKQCLLTSPFVDSFLAKHTS